MLGGCHLIFSYQGADQGRPDGPRRDQSAGDDAGVEGHALDAGPPELGTTVSDGPATDLGATDTGQTPLTWSSVPWPACPRKICPSAGEQGPRVLLPDKSVGSRIRRVLASSPSPEVVPTLEMIWVQIEPNHGWEKLIIAGGCTVGPNPRLHGFR